MKVRKIDKIWQGGGYILICLLCLASSATASQYNSISLSISGDNFKDPVFEQETGIDAALDGATRCLTKQGEQQ